MDAIVVDPKQFVAESVAFVLHSMREPDVRVRRAFTCNEEAAKSAGRADLCVADTSACDGSAGERVRQMAGGCYVELTAEESVSHFSAVWEAGADAYVLKRWSSRRLRQAVRKATGGERVAPTHLLEKRKALQSAGELTERQSKWAELHLGGLPNEEIAKRMGVTKGAVRQLKHRVKQKLGAEAHNQVTEILKAKLT